MSTVGRDLRIIRERVWLHVRIVQAYVIPVGDVVEPIRTTIGFHSRNDQCGLRGAGHTGTDAMSPGEFARSGLVPNGRPCEGFVLVRRSEVEVERQNIAQRTTEDNKVNQMPFLPSHRYSTLLPLLWFRFTAGMGF